MLQFNTRIFFIKPRYYVSLNIFAVNEYLVSFLFLVTVAEELDATVGVSMDRFVYQNGLSSTFMAPIQQQQQQHYYPLTATTAMMSARFGKMSKLTAEKKSHSEAESRRRKRINDHLFTLRSILPSKVKVSLITCSFSSQKLDSDT